MITTKEVQHIAKLARLGLAEKGIKKFQKELSSVLDYIEKLKKVEISGIESTSHSIRIIRIENIMRADENGKSEINSQKLLELAPEKKNSYLKVKKII